jgi:hypothetical protein
MVCAVIRLHDMIYRYCLRSVCEISDTEAEGENVSSYWMTLTL